jgi:hypothetical protein
MDHTGAVRFFKRPETLRCLIAQSDGAFDGNVSQSAHREPTGIKSRTEVFPCSANCFCSSLSKPVFLSRAQPSAEGLSPPDFNPMISNPSRNSLIDSPLQIQIRPSAATAGCRTVRSEQDNWRRTILPAK